MTIEEFLWVKLEKARMCRKQVEELPQDKPMRAAIVALANQAVIEAVDSWKSHITRDSDER